MQCFILDGEENVLPLVPILPVTLTPPLQCAPER